MSDSTWPDRVGRVALPFVDSTNAEAFRRAPHLPGPAWILAAEQTAGRGRRARPWASPRGNFYATHVMQPSEPPQTIALRSFVAALALHDALSVATGSPQAIALKWPNDVLLSGGKVAGILLECQTAGQGSQTLAIGIGVNLIGHPDAAQVEPGATPPVSVLSESGQRLTPEGFLALLAPAYARWEAVFIAQGFAPIRTAWLGRAARLGEPIRARTGTHDRQGIFESIDADGNLILRTPHTTLAIPAAEVFF
ncbi:MAG: biotin--[acetyl-CoA-carboxylase] ligase [Pseudotabrizicola sp.]|uniref:biotin--[acetyl-CoA-carboxylase] ligase n=1 Tax=Pseudotabrizicola sp. TaxID=2939647 RepID=UPI002731B1B7|nr:biotin--[acetyl-CoA-carboxylase] ligase [Pseudotabrizicola sp.]MDP2083091.1 biotin--[acetyl-CoA-carboxylase] ligase [Pseudotabrizicola sp.]MDZ7572509.1 biotin--[acetyl-CoA-carboxylase] ligase [Pseudotabrizicola sp.]